MSENTAGINQDNVSLVSTLFKQKGLTGIQDVRQKLCMDVEKQREELRLIVGERYQELILAADTFKSMKQCSSQTLEGIEHCKHLCSKMVGMETKMTHSSPQSIRLKFDDNSVVSLSIVRWLTETIPQIWQCVEERHLPQALKKYLQSYAALQSAELRVIHKDSTRLLTKKLQSTIEVLPGTISSTALGLLEETKLKPKVAQECLFSLIILEKLTLSDALAKFLAARSLALKKLCQKTVTFSAFKNSLSEWELFVTSTLLSIEGTFGADRLDGAMFAKLSELDDHICEANPLIEKNIPENIRNFKIPLDLKCDLTPVAVEEAQGVWIKEAKSLIAGVLEPFFRSVTSIRSCAQLRQLAFQKLILSELGNSTFWQEYFWPVVRTRVNNILVKGMNEAYELCLNSLKSDLETRPVSNDDYLRWMWSESAENAHQVALLSHTNDLALKSRGIYTTVRTAYHTLDEKVESVIKDVEYYRKHLEASENELKELQESVRSSAHVLVDTFLNQSFEHLQFGKLLFSIAELKGCLHTALSYGDTSNLLWSDLKCNLNSAYEQQLNTWIDKIVADFKTDLTLKLNGLVESGPVSLSLRWETVELEGTAARVPCGISLPFQGALDKIEENVYAAGGHTLGRNAMSRLTTLLGTAVVDSFGDVVEHPVLKQNLALQFYFDVQFTSSLLLRRENKELQSRARNLLENLEARIDPVDLGILSSHWQNQVTAAVNSQKLLYHCITPFEKAGIQKVKMNPVASGNHLRIATASTCSRFSLLPVIVKHEKQSVNGLEEQRNIVPSAIASKSVERDIASASSSTRSFLGAMSSSWFGTTK